MSYFDVTEAEIKEAVSSGKVELKDGETPTFLIEEVKEGENDKGAFIRVVLKFVGGEHDGKSYSMFFGEHPVQKKILLTLFSTFIDQAEIVKLGLRGCMTKVVSKQFKTQAKVNDGGYVNFYKFTEVGGAPQLQAVSNSDIPF